MNELFGLSMTVIATACVVITAFIFLFIAWIAFRNPVMFKTGLRNIPRRKMQTGLIVVGLMLSTLIITAAFGTGDTLAKSVTNEVYGILGPADEFIEWDTKAFPAPEDQQTIPIETVDAWQKQFVGDGTVRAMFPYLSEHIPVQNLRTRLNEANPRITAFRAADVAPFGGLKDTDGRSVALKDDEIALNETLAGNIDARVGDAVRLFYQGSQLDLKVAAIVPSNLLGGASDGLAKEGASVTWDFLAKTVGREGKADFVAVSNNGTERGGLSASSAVAAKIKPVLAGTPYKVEEVKKDQVRSAELIGNVFTTIFIIFGLFSIAAGVLLIFLIFVMLAAERKPEMGMARAVGAKRRQIVESFLAEGMGYDIGAAIVGLFAGIGVAAAMMLFVKLRIGEDLGLDLRFYVSLRSMIVSFCLGIIVTFVVVFVASWRASRLNIVAAIRPPRIEALRPGARYLGRLLAGVAQRLRSLRRPACFADSRTLSEGTCAALPAGGRPLRWRPLAGHAARTQLRRAEGEAKAGRKPAEVALDPRRRPSPGGRRFPYPHRLPPGDARRAPHA